MSAEYTARAVQAWREAGVEDRVDLRIAPAVDTLRAMPPDPPIDLAFIDADKSGYDAYYEAILRLMRPGWMRACALREMPSLSISCTRLAAPVIASASFGSASR